MRFGTSVRSGLNLKRMKMKKLKKGERGFTLVELLIVLAITGLVTSGITMTVFQVFNINTRTTNRMTAVRQVENAGFWVSHDVQMAMYVSTSDFLELTWIEWDTSNNHTVIYSLEDMPAGLKKLQREHNIYIDSELDSTTTTIVAEYIDLAQTNCVTQPEGAEPEGVEVLTFTVTATVGGQSETREYEVMPRPGT